MEISDVNLWQSLKLVVSKRQIYGLIGIKN